MLDNLFYLLTSTIISPTPDPVTTQAAETVTEAATTATAAQPSLIVVIIYCVVIFGAFYFLSVRPQKKRDKELLEIRNNIKPGDSVLLGGGFYGIVADVTAECFIIDFGLNKGTRIPVMKGAVIAVREPNLSNKVEAPVEEEKTSFFGSLFGKKNKDDEDDE